MNSGNIDHLLFGRESDGAFDFEILPKRPSRPTDQHCLSTYFLADGKRDNNDHQYGVLIQWHVHDNADGIIATTNLLTDVPYR